MIIDCISDLHGHYPELEGGDLLIVAGDFTASNRPEQYEKFFTWLSMQDHYTKKILVCGNHDTLMQDTPTKKIENGIYHYLECCEYLCDSGTEFQGLKIWGSPWTQWFDGVNPHCTAFMKSDKRISKKFALIPTDTDILVTHSPPFTILDLTTRNEQVGSPSLMAEHMSRFRPKLWVFGHIHESYGQEGPYQWSGTKYVNASHVNERYEPVNKPIRVIL